jgi:glucose-6-phosphate 1-epimerase
VSDRSPFEAGKAIRGGIPVVFPQFAERGPLVKHGFARTAQWALAGASATGEGASVSFSLEASSRTLALWPGVFRLELVATLGRSSLEVELRVANAGAKDFAFAAALHTYLSVSEAASARLEGLKGVRCLDRESSQAKLEDRAIVTAGEAIDRMYFSVPRELRLEDGNRILAIAQRGFGDTVVWNPGADLAAQMADMHPAGYRRMLCVEAAAIDPEVALAPGAAWIGAQSIAVS